MLAIVPATWRVLTMRHSIAIRVNVCVPLTAVDECCVAAIWSHSDVAIGPRVERARRALHKGVSNMTLVVTGKAADLDQPAEVAVEGEIREFVRRDGPSLRRTPEMDSELVANNISTLLQRVAGSSVQEIDRLISELQTLRDMLHEEGARVQREITEYAHLSQSAMQSTKIIAESLGKWKGGSDWAPRAAVR
jgi:hypothetical protein